MAQTQLSDKVKRAAEVICRQGRIQFPAAETAVTIIAKAEAVPDVGFPEERSL